MKHRIKPIFTHVICIALVALHFGCTKEIIPTDTDTLNGNNTGVHLTLLPPTIAIDGATATRADGQISIVDANLYIQLVDAKGAVLKHKDGMLQQSWFTCQDGNWTLQVTQPCTSNIYCSKAIIVTGGAGIYRMRVMADITASDGTTTTPYTYFGAVEVADKGDGTGTFSLHFKDKLTTAIQVKLVADNGAELPSTNGKIYRIKNLPDKLPAIGISPDFHMMEFNSDTNNLATLISDGAFVKHTDAAEMMAVPATSFLTPVQSNFEPITIAANTPILTIELGESVDNSGSPGFEVSETYRVATSAAMTFKAGHKHLLTIAISGRDASIATFTIADMVDGEGIDVNNNGIKKVGDTYHITTAKGVKTAADPADANALPLIVAGAPVEAPAAPINNK